MKTMEEPTSRPSSTFLQQLADRIGVNARASTVYGEPVVNDGITIVPVAKVAYGFGGGAGGGRESDGSSEGEGSGGGGGVRVTPLGYIELNNGVSTYRPIRDPMMTVAMIAAGGIAVSVVLRGAGRLLKSVRGTMPPKLAGSD